MADIWTGNSHLPDVVLNTHVFEFLLEDEFIQKILRDRTHVFVAKCAYRKEYRARHAQLVSLLHKNSRRIQPFFHCKNADNPHALPTGLKKEMCKNGASNCDIIIAALACDRNQSQQDVILVSNDPHFNLVKACFERHGVHVLSRDEFLANQA